MRSSPGADGAAAGFGAAAAGCAAARGGLALDATFATGRAFFDDARFGAAFLALFFLATPVCLAAVLRRAAALVARVFVRLVLALRLAFCLVAMTASQLRLRAQS